MPQKDIANSMLSQALWLAVIILVSLYVLSFLPAMTIGTYHFKKIDILGDLHPEESIEIINTPDTTTTIETKKTKGITPNKSATTAIQDFSKGENALKYFIKALSNSTNQPVRIAFFGDSFIEGDIITASLRDSLQKVFGGNGVGFVPLAAETAGFRKSIKHNYENWTTQSIISSTSDNIPLGISGYTYIPEDGNSVTYKPGKTPPQKDFKRVRLFYQTNEPTIMQYTINNETETTEVLDPTDSLSQIIINHNNIQSLGIHIVPNGKTYLFGISFEDKKGIYVDNFSMRRNSGVGLAKLSPTLLKQFNKYLDYKLIVLQYGLNVASETDSTNYEWYSSKMISLIHSLKSIFPYSSFLLLSVSDRGVNKDGKIVTMEAITKLRNAQREIARKSGIAYWDLFEAMGGRNSIAKYTESNPPLAAKDYTHLTHLGGNRLGLKLASELLYQYKTHDR